MHLSQQNASLMWARILLGISHPTPSPDSFGILQFVSVFRGCDVVLWTPHSSWGPQSLFVDTRSLWCTPTSFHKLSSVHYSCQFSCQVIFICDENQCQLIIIICWVLHLSQQEVAENCQRTRQENENFNFRSNQYFQINIVRVISSFFWLICLFLKRLRLKWMTYRKTEIISQL